MQLKILSFIRHHAAPVCLIALVGVIFVSHLLYVSATYQHAKWDEHLFLDEGVATYRFLISPDKTTLSSMLISYAPRPPLYGTVIAFGILFAGITNTYKIALVINGIFYCGAIIATYFLAKEFLSKRSSVLASAIFAFYGFPLFYLHFAYSETATTFFVVLTLLFLKKSRNFSRVKQTGLFALFFALGNLTRWMIPVFVGLPTLFSYLIGLQKQISPKTRYMQGLFVSSLCFIIIGFGLPLLFYYLPNLANTLHYLAVNRQFDAQWVSELTYLPPGLKDVLSIHSLMFYFNILSQQTVFFFTLFIIGFLLSLRFIKQYHILILTFIGAYLILTFGAVLKDDRYIVPIYPTMAIISAIVFDHISKSSIRKVLIAITLIIGLLNFFGSSWGFGPMGQQGLKDIVLPSFFPHPRRIYLTPMVWPPRKDEIHEREIVRVALQDFGKRSHTPRILNTYTFNPLELDIAFSSMQKYETNNAFTAINLRVIDRGNYGQLFTVLNTADYVILKSDKKMVDPGKYTNYPTDMMIIIFNKALSLGDLPPAFIPLRTVEYPLDKVKLTVYKKTRDVTSDEWVAFGNLLIQVDPQFKQQIQEVFR